jgi:putative transposase
MSLRSSGLHCWRNRTIYVNQALVGEPVGVVENATGWIVCYGPIMLGTIAHQDDRLRKPKRSGCGLVDNATRCPQGPQPQQQQT